MKSPKQQRRTMAPATSGRTKRRVIQRGGGSSASTGLAQGMLMEGVVRSVDETWRVAATLADGESISALCPAHIDRGWLRAAAAHAPVAAVFAVAQPSGRHVLWGLFPSEVHAEIRADIVVRGRHVVVDAESAQITTRAGAQLDLERDGNTSLRGRDITTHARRVNRIKGGAVRIN